MKKYLLIFVLLLSSFNFSKTMELLNPLSPQKIEQQKQQEEKWHQEAERRRQEAERSWELEKTILIENAHDGITLLNTLSEDDVVKIVVNLRNQKQDNNLFGRLLFEIFQKKKNLISLSINLKYCKLNNYQLGLLAKLTGKLEETTKTLILDLSNNKINSSNLIYITNIIKATKSKRFELDLASNKIQHGDTKKIFNALGNNKKIEELNIDLSSNKIIVPLIIDYLENNAENITKFVLDISSCTMSSQELRNLRDTIQAIARGRNFKITAIHTVSRSIAKEMLGSLDSQDTERNRFLSERHRNYAIMSNPSQTSFEAHLSELSTSGKAVINIDFNSHERWRHDAFIKNISDIISTNLKAESLTLNLSKCHLNKEDGIDIGKGIKFNNIAARMLGTLSIGDRYYFDREISNSKGKLNSVSIDFSNNMLGDEGAEQLLKNALMNSQITYLNFNLTGNGITNEGVNRIAQIISRRKNPMTIQITILDSHIDITTTQQLRDAIANNQHLTRDSKCITIHPDIRNRVIKTINIIETRDIVSIALSHSNLTADERNLLIESIKQKRSIKKLSIDLGENKIDSFWIEMLTIAIKENPKITNLELYFYENNIDDDGVRYISNMIATYLPNLKHIVINLIDNPITTAGVSRLISDFRLADQIENMHLEISKENINEEELQDLNESIERANRTTGRIFKLDTIDLDDYSSDSDDY